MLNKIKLSENRFLKASLAFIFFTSLIGLSCGKRKPPLPPVERIIQRAEISGTQRGNIINLSWNLPAQNTSAGNTLNISSADIYRLAESLTAPLTLSEDEFASRSTLISTLPVTVEDFRRGQLAFTDTLQFSSQPARLRYAVRFVNASGQKAAFSNFLIIEPTSKVAGNPTLLTAQVSDNAVLLSWIAPKENVDGSTPVNIIGYNVYRISGADDSANVLNNTLLTENKFNDRSFDFGADYRYFVRTVSLGGGGETVESLNSNTIELKPKDTFAPRPPSALTIAAAPGNLSIFFAVNTERDLAGYLVYRSNNSDKPLSDWTLLTKELLTINTYRDTNVESGKTYFYYLIAVDKNGNVSDPSETISETAP
jgi:fibronectin type 3 domain-containing protein